jgi:hypothetical protein
VHSFTWTSYLWLAGSRGLVDEDGLRKPCEKKPLLFASRVTLHCKRQLTPSGLRANEFLQIQQPLIWFRQDPQKSGGLLDTAF